MWPRALAPAGFLIAIAVLFAGSAATCGRLAPLALLQLQDLTPREVELGDRVVLIGSGFPAGKPARIVFRGSLYRPGERPERRVAIPGSGVVVGPDRIELPFGEELEGLFCRSGDRAAHTTFEGDVEVAFAAAAPGAPPVAGVLPGVTIDVRPGAVARADGREDDGRRLLAYLGLHLATAGDEAARGAGLTIDAVAPRSPAEQAGIAAGDVISRFNGVRVASVADLLPAPGAAEAAIAVRRGGGAEVVRSVPVGAYCATQPSEVLGSALAVFGALAFAFFWALPFPAPLACALDSALRRARALVPADGGAAPGGDAAVFAGRRGADAARLVRAVCRSLAAEGPRARLPWLVDAGTWGALAVLPFGQYLLAARLDVGVLFAGAAAGLAVVAALGAPSAVRGGRAALQVVVQHVPAMLAVASAVVATGSLRGRELTQAQGGWPWEWLAFHGLGTLVATGLLARTVRVGTAVGAASLGPWARAAVRAHRRILLGLVAVLFLGGWALPASSAAQDELRPILEGLGAAVFVGKIAVLTLAADVLAWAWPPGALERETRAVVVLWAPLGGACVGAAVVASGVGWAGARSLASSLLVLFAAAFCVACAWRWRDGWRRLSPAPHLSPFL